MVARQTSLDFSSPVENKAPTASVGDVAALVKALTGKDWQTADSLAVARASAPGIVSYPGSPGYKLWSECSVEEIDRTIAAFESQATDMTARALLYRDAYFRRFRG